MISCKNCEGSEIIKMAYYEEISVTYVRSVNIILYVEISVVAILRR